MYPDKEFEPRVSLPPEPDKPNGHRLEEWGPETIELLSADGTENDESIQVYVKQGGANQPVAELEFVNCTSIYAVMNFGPKELRQLAEFLCDCADRLEYYKDHKV